jgi:hypothetical protein
MIKKMKQQHIVLIFSAILFAVSAVWLSYASQRHMDPNYQKNWWSLSFSDPKGRSMDFIISNHSPQTTFHWQILADKTVVNENDVAIAKGESKTVPVITTDFQDKKITILVTHISDSDKKEIYKNL